MKAIVMETRGREAAILLEDGTFRTVKGSYSVGETIDWREGTRPAFRKWMAAAAAAVVMIGGGGGFWYDNHYAAYAEISLDVNPSIVYTVNKRSEVLSVRAVNDEAAGTVSALEEAGIRFMPVAEAIDRTMTLFENEGYLDAENEDYVLMNVSVDDAGIQESVIAEIETGMGRAMERDPSMKYRVDHSDRAMAKRAEESDMSTGRYALWEQEGSGREPREFAEMPVRELMEKPDEAPPEKPEGKPEEVPPERTEGKAEDTAQEMPEGKAEDTALEMPEGKPEETPPEMPEGKAEEAPPEMPEADSTSAPQAETAAPAAPAGPEAGMRRQDDRAISGQRPADGEMTGEGERHQGFEAGQPGTGPEPPFQEVPPDMRRGGEM